MNELLDLEVKERMQNEQEIRHAIHGLERALVWVGLILTLAVGCLTTQVLQQADKIKQLQEQVRENRESILHQAEVNERQEVILSKLNQEYQMKHYQKGENK